MVIKQGGEILIFSPDDEDTDCSKYDLTPVSVINNIDGTFDVYSNVCGFNIFESQPKIDSLDRYFWADWDELIVETEGRDYGSTEYTDFLAETEDQDCDAYDRPGQPKEGFVTRPVELYSDIDGERMHVWSTVCKMNVWIHQVWDRYDFNGDVLEITRFDDSDSFSEYPPEDASVSIFEYPSEGPDVDCDAYLTKLGIEVIYALEVR